MSAGAPFSIAQGGPLYRALRSHGFITPSGPKWMKISMAFVAITWLPFVLIGLGEWAVTGRAPAALLELSLHTRLLVAVPIVLIAELVLDERCAAVLRRVDDQMLDDDGKARLTHVVGRAERLRDSWLPEAIILVLAEILGQAARHTKTLVVGFETSASLLANADSLTFSFYVLVGLPLFALFTYRWLFRWLIWSIVLFELSRMDLHPIATHPDRSGGLDCLSEPMDGFAVFAFGIASVAAASWWDAIRATGTALKSYAPTFAGLLFAATVLSCGPLLVFMMPMHRARLHAIRDYGDVVRDFVRSLEAGWLRGGSMSDSSPIGSLDSSHLADIDTAYRNMASMQLIPLRLLFLAHIVIALVIPMLPLVASQIPVMDLIRGVTHAALGAVPF